MKKLLIIFFTIFSIQIIYAQDSLDLIFRTIHPGSELIDQNDGSWSFVDVNLNTIFENENLNVQTAFPNASKIDELTHWLNYYYVRTDPSTALGVYNILQSGFGNYFDKLELLSFQTEGQMIGARSSREEIQESLPEGEMIGVMCPTNDPKDLWWNIFRHDLMNVQEAFCHTQGDPSVKIGIFDSGYEINHEDLKHKYDYIGPVPNFATKSHGTSSAGCAAAHTNNNIAISSSGYNSRLLLYHYLGSTHNINNLMDAYSRGSRVVNYASYCSSYSSLVEDVINDLTNEGMIFVAAAGNGKCGPPYTSPHDYCYPAAYDNVISISGVNKVKCFEHGSTSKCDPKDEADYYTHNDKVDFVAPAFEAYVLDARDWDGNGIFDDCDIRGGTSYAAPMVTGVVALLLSVNPCLNHDNVMDILTLTETDVSGVCNNQDYYPNAKVPGLVNAEDAVIMALDYGYQDYVIPPGTTTWSNADVLAGKITILTGGELIISNDTKVTMKHETGNIVVQRGAKLVVNNSLLTACKKWDGIYVEGNASQIQSTHDVMPAVNQSGVVHITNGSTIEKANTAISTTRYNEHWNQPYWGGLVVVDGDSKFYDNWRAVEFMKYDFSNKSYFEDCVIKEYDDNVESSHGVTIWSTDDISFNNCRFENMDRQAITVYDAGADIIKENEFFNNNIGVESFATYPFTSWTNIGHNNNTISERNWFKNNIEYNVIVYASDEKRQDTRDGLRIIKNKFEGGLRSVIFVGPTQHRVFDNTFAGHLYGVGGLETSHYENLVDCNSFSSISYTGISYWGKNNNSQFWLNDFDCNVDLDMNSWQNLGEMFRIQGNGKAAENCFTNLHQEDIASLSPNTIEFKYIHSPNPNQPNCHIVPTNNLSDNGTNNYKLDQISFVNTCDISNGPGGGCNFTNQDWINALALITQLNSALSTDPGNESLIDQLATATLEKSTILRCLLDDAIDENDLIMAYQLLDQEGSIHSQRVKYGILLNNGDITGATTQLNSLPNSSTDDLYFNQVQLINLSRLSTTGIYSLTSIDEALLTSIGLSQTISSAYARSLLALLTDIRLPLNFPLTPPNGGAKRKAVKAVRNSMFRLVKNPVSDILTIVSNKKTTQPYQLRIVDMNGYTINQRSIIMGSNLVEIDINSLKPSIYLISIIDKKGILVYKNKFVKI